MENYEQLEKMVGAELSCGYKGRIVRAFFPNYLFNNLIEGRYSFRDIEVIDGITCFTRGNSFEAMVKRSQKVTEICEYAEKLFPGEIMYRVNDHQMELIEKNNTPKTPKIHLYTVSPYFNDGVTDGGEEFAKDIKKKLENLISMLSPNLLKKYSVIVLPAEKSIYYPGPGHTITICIGTRMYRHIHQAIW